MTSSTCLYSRQPRKASTTKTIAIRLGQRLAPETDSTLCQHSDAEESCVEFKKFARIFKELTCNSSSKFPSLFLVYERKEDRNLSSNDPLMNFIQLWPRSTCYTLLTYTTVLYAPTYTKFLFANLPRHRSAWRLPSKATSRNPKSISLASLPVPWIPGKYVLL